MFSKVMMINIRNMLAAKQFGEYVPIKSRKTHPPRNDREEYYAEDIVRALYARGMLSKREIAEISVDNFSMYLKPCVDAGIIKRFSSNGTTYYELAENITLENFGLDEHEPESSSAMQGADVRLSA